MSTPSLGFSTICEHKMVVLPALTSRIRPGRPQYSAGPCLSGICRVYQASTCVYSTAFSSVLSLSLPHEKSYQLKSSVGMEAVALKHIYCPINLDSAPIVQLISWSLSFTKNFFP